MDIATRVVIVPKNIKNYRSVKRRYITRQYDMSKSGDNALINQYCFLDTYAERE